MCRFRCIAARRAAVPAGLLLWLVIVSHGAHAQASPAEPATRAAAVAGPGVPSVVLTDAQIQSVRVTPVASRPFKARNETVGYVDFDQDRVVPVFSPWAGRIRAVFVRAGDKVKAGSPLLSIDSPDLVQAESTLIAAAGVLQLTGNALERARKLLSTQASAQ